jgi:hypothetical protein
MSHRRNRNSLLNSYKNLGRLHCQDICYIQQYINLPVVDFWVMTLCVMWQDTNVSEAQVGSIFKVK